MKQQRRWYQKGFSGKERLGMVVLAVLILLMLLIPEWMQRWHPPEPIRLSIDDTLFVTIDSSHLHQGSGYYKSGASASHPASLSHLFFFDPNTLDMAGWKRLGLPEKSIKTILRYIEKGGRFRKPADIHRIFGLHPQLADQLEPYVRIEGPQQDSQESLVDPFDARSPLAKTGVRNIDINTADSAQWESLPGIGAILAARIVQFRGKLGGFYSIEQLREVYGLRDSTFQILLPMLRYTGGFSPLDINNSPQEVLAAHPYIKWRAARIISAWKKEHGPFTSPEQLLLTGALDSAALRKLTPYLHLGK